MSSPPPAAWTVSPAPDGRWCLSYAGEPRSYSHRKEMLDQMAELFNRTGKKPQKP